MTTQPTPSLQTFTLNDLAEFTNEGEFAPDDSPDMRGFAVGWDDVHGILLHLLTRATVSLKMNMYGFDDPAVNDAVMALVQNPQVMVQVSLDKSQAGGTAERPLLTGDVAKDPKAFAAHFAIGTSATHQILHTKGGILDNVVAWEGSTNLSGSGEGIGIGLHGKPNVTGFKAQANTLTVYTNPREIAKFAARLDDWYAVAAAQPQPAWVTGS